MKKTMGLIVAGLMTLLVGLSDAQAEVSDYLPVGGVLADDTTGDPLDGYYDVVFALYGQEAGGTALWSESRMGENQLQVQDGLFTAYLGEVTSLDFAELLDSSELWLGIKVGADSEMNRIKLGSVPFAMEAQYCRAMRGVTCEAGKLLRGWDDATGEPICESDQLGDTTDMATQTWVGSQDYATETWSSTAFQEDIASTTCDHGIESIADNGSVECANSDVSYEGLNGDYGTEETVARSDHLHDESYVSLSGSTMTGALNLPANGLVIGTDQMVVASGGVGIGTDTPSEQLEVAGTIYSTSGGFKFPDNSVQTTAAGSGGYWEVSGSDIYNTNSGNVGIGTDTPSAKLDVAGSVNAQRYNKVAIPTAYTSAAIQTAINTVGGEGGGLVFLPAGTYAVTSTINITQPHITVRGTGLGTVLDGAGFAGGTMMATSGYGTTTETMIEKLVFKGSSTEGGSSSDASIGLSLGSGTVSGKVDTVWFINLYSRSISDNFANAWSFVNCVFSTFSGTGIYLSNVYEAIIHGCRFYSTTAAYGIYSATYFAQNTISDNRMSLLGSSAVAGIWLSSYTNCTVNIVSNNNIDVSANTSANVYGINSAATKSIILGNRFTVTNSGSGSGQGIVSTGDYCVVSANVSKDSKAANSISGTGTVTSGANVDGP